MPKQLFPVPRTLPAIRKIFAALPFPVHLTGAHGKNSKKRDAPEIIHD
jgi:hypothetical protein